MQIVLLKVSTWCDKIMNGSNWTFPKSQGCINTLSNNEFTSSQIEEDLMDYGSHTNNSFGHTWYDNPMAMRRQNVHFSANTFAIDANTTFAVSTAFILFLKPKNAEY